MIGSQVAVLDFGSGKISVLVGEKNQSGTLKIVAKGISDYAGFMDGEFLEPNALRNAISRAIDEAEGTLRKRIRKLVLGVPAEFSYNQCELLSLSYHKRVKLHNGHVKKLIATGAERIASDRHSVINLTPLYFKLDDGSKIENPIGMQTTALSSYVSYVLVENSFINLVSSALYELGIKKFEFASSPLTAGMYLLDAESQKNGALLIDCGYITTSVSFIVNNGLADLKSFSLGGGHIASDLAEVLQIPFSTAEQLKRKVVVSLAASEKDFYEVIVNNKLTKFSARKVNDIVLARVDTILDTVLESVEAFENELNPNSKIMLTGGGISYIKGIKKYATDYLKQNVEIVAPKPLQWSKPDLLSEISLLDVATTK